MHPAPARLLQQAEAPATPHWPVFTADKSKTDAQGVSKRCMARVGDCYTRFTAKKKKKSKHRTQKTEKQTTVYESP